VQVDSAGHTFADFKATSSRTQGHLWAGGTLPCAPVDRTRPNSTEFSSAKLNGIDYASRGHGFLILHANKGVTFDLEAVRRANPGYKLVRFRSVAGNAEPISQHAEVQKMDWPTVFADLWVLVDGHSRYQRREINGLSGGFAVDIPIRETDRFLTLVGTDSGNDFNLDWILFGDPRLELVPEAIRRKEGTDSKAVQ
jgi:hypothetical protein